MEEKVYVIITSAIDRRHRLALPSRNDREREREKKTRYVNSFACVYFVFHGKVILTKIYMCFVCDSLVAGATGTYGHIRQRSIIAG